MDSMNNAETISTLDKRTFTECSQRMRRLTPTLPRKDTENEKMQGKVDGILQGRPTPPPRHKKVLQAQRPTNNGQGNEISKTVLIAKRRTDSINVENTEIIEMPYRNGIISDSQFADASKQGGLKSPLRRFVNYMSEIANNVNILSCPP